MFLGAKGIWGSPRSATDGHGSVKAPSKKCSLTWVFNVSFKVDSVKRLTLNFVMRIKGTAGIAGITIK